MDLILGIVLAGITVVLAALTLYYSRRSAQIAEEELSARKAKDFENPPKFADVPEKQEWPEIISPGIGLDRQVVGREKDVEELHRKLQTKTGVAILPGIVVKAAGGMGKTTLARYYIKHYRRHYRGIWWLRAQTRQTIIDDLAELARQLGVEDSGQGAESLARDALTKLQDEPGPWLLVYDNAERTRDISDLRPRVGNIHLLLTSREGGWSKQYEVMEAERLNLEDATNLLMREAGRTDDPEGATRLAIALDGLPLALVNAGAWLRDTPGTSFADYQERLEDLLRHKPETVEDYPDSVFAAVTLSLGKLSDEATMLMSVYARLQHDDIWPELVSRLKAQSWNNDSIYSNIVSRVPSALVELAIETDRLRRAELEIERASLVRIDGPRYRIHPLVQRTVRSADSTGLVDWDEVTLALLALSFPSDSEHKQSWVLVERVLKHTHSVLKSTDESTIPNAYLARRIAQFRLARGEVARAFQIAEQLNERSSDNSDSQDQPTTTRLECNVDSLRSYLFDSVKRDELDHEQDETDLRPPTVAFYCYTRKDDRHTNGLLSQIRAELEKAIEFKCGRHLEVFQDVDDISEGDEWQQKINMALDTATVFVPILTPSFFTSPYCLQELSRFREKLINTGNQGIILPIHFSEIKLVVLPLSEELLEFIKNLQWFDWTHHENQRRINQQLRIDISALATRIIEIWSGSR